MKAITKCPKCGEIITTNCKACIDNERAEHHVHNNVKVKWKKVPETENELNELEDFE